MNFKAILGCTVIISVLEQKNPPGCGGVIKGHPTGGHIYSSRFPLTLSCCPSLQFVGQHFQKNAWSEVSKPHPNLAPALRLDFWTSMRPACTDESLKLCTWQLSDTSCLFRNVKKNSRLLQGNRTSLSRKVKFIQNRENNSKKRKK